MSTQHTPGPWRLDGLSAHVVTADNGSIEVARCGHETTHPVTEQRIAANARLIAAAPELLAALRQVQDISAEMGRSGREGTFGLRLYDAVQPAITKATNNHNDWETRHNRESSDA